MAPSARRCQASKRAASGGVSQRSAARHVLMIQDTSEINYQANAARVSGLGKVGNGSYSRDQVYGEVGHSEEPMSTAVRNAANAPERVYYKVVSGDTLESVAKKCGVSVETICRLNGYRKNQRIRPGQIIRYV